MCRTPKKDQVRDYSTWSYRLQWADGTETGTGAALKQIVEYSHTLAKNMLSEGHREKTGVLLRVLRQFQNRFASTVADLPSHKPSRNFSLTASRW